MKIAALLFFGFWASLVGSSIYGLVLAFGASFWVGLIALVLEPMPLIWASQHLQAMPI